MKENECNIHIGRIHELPKVEIGIDRKNKTVVKILLIRELRIQKAANLCHV